MKKELERGSGIGSLISCTHQQLVLSGALLLICTSGFLLLPTSNAQSEYVSIDCGSGSNYTDSSTGLFWSTDDQFTGKGVNRNVNEAVSNSQTENPRQLSTARYFSESTKKNCYIFQVQSNASYLIRASFLYGDLESTPPSGYFFNLSIDSNVVGSIRVSSSNAAAAQYPEYFIVATSNEIAFCIIPVVGTPFISALELRPLDSSMYSAALYNSKYTKSLVRFNCGASSTDPAVRYPDDTYDRLWKPPGSGFNKINSINTTASVDIMAADKPPIKVMQTAWTGRFWFSILLDESASSTYYIALYIAEILTYNTTTQVRVMDVLLNGNALFTGFYVGNAAKEISEPQNRIVINNANFSVQSNFASTLQGILNGFEMHEVYDIDTTTTPSAQVLALTDLRESLTLSDSTGDPCLPVAWDWLNCSNNKPPSVTQLKLSGNQRSGMIPASISSLTDLTDLWLDNNYLTGSIPDMSNFTLLKTVHLQNNSLTGTIPSLFAKIPYLSELWLENNNLSGPVPAALLSKNGLDLRVDDYLLSSNASSPSTSPPVQGSPPPPGPPPPATEKKNSGISGAVIGGVIGAVAILIALLLLAVLFFFCRRKKKNKVMSPLQTQTETKKIGPYVTLQSSRNSVAVGGASGHLQVTRAFSQPEVLEATSNFNTKIGEGGFGPVYYGKLDTDQEVAVKRNLSATGQSLTEFSTEVSLLSRVHHRNLVSLVGFCDDGGEQILIYEYMQSGTLRDRLYGKGTTKINWRARLDIALNAARGLEYLHYDCNPKIIHRDVKSNNILLNDKFFAKVGDFGISKQSLDDDNTNGVSTEVRGSTGYFDPEYFSTNKITYKSDVYAFGVVLLEIMSGRPPNDAKLPNLVDFGRRALRDGNLEPIVDTYLRGTYNIEAMWKMAELAVCCVEPLSMDRPDMRQVVRELVETRDLEYSRQDLRKTHKTHTFPNAQNFTQSTNDDTTSSQPSQPSYPTTPSSRADTPSSTRTYFASSRDNQSTPSSEFPHWSEPRAR